MRTCAQERAEEDRKEWERATNIKRVAQHFHVWVPPLNNRDRMDHMTKVIMPRIPHHIADALEMRGDAKGAAGARNKADLVDRFIEVCRVTASSTFVGGACVLKVGWRAGAGCGS